MPHPTEGVLRRLLDDPSGVAAADRDHVAACDRCRAEQALVRADADLVHAALTPDATDVDLDAAWHRLSAADARPATTPFRPAPTVRAGRLRSAMRRPVVGAVAVGLVLTGAGTAAANDWFEIFRTERIEPVAIDASSLNALPDLAAYGDVDLSGEPDVRAVPDAATAEDETGLDVPEVGELPRGVVGEPTYRVGDEVAATFTFDADQAAAEVGDLPPVPPGLDGSEVRLVAGPGVAQTWTSGGSGAPALVVGRAVAPRAFASGVPFDVWRDYLLSLPGLPDDVAGPLRTFNADGSTLPLPVPEGRFTTSEAEVGGAPATLLVSHDRSMAGVAWVDDGMLTVVAGTLDADEVLAVARGLR